jgi:hypothetical protein
MAHDAGDQALGAISTMRRLALATAAAVLMAACSGMPAPWPSPNDLHVVNETTRAMTILLNGTMVTTVAAQESVTLSAASLPAGNWRVEARLPGGRVVLGTLVEQASVIPMPEVGGKAIVSGSSMWADLSCGRIGVWVGTPAERPPVGPGVPGDCEG